MDCFMQWMIGNSVKAAVLCTLVFVICFCCSKYLSPRWKYFLWLLVAVRLLLPEMIPARCSIFNLWNEKISAVRESAAFTRSDLDVAQVNNSGPVVTAVVSQLHESEVPVATVAEQEIQISGWMIIFMVWLAGGSTLATLVLYRTLKFKMQLRFRSSLCGVKWQEVLDDCRKQMGVRQSVELVASSLVKSPALAGVIHPIILLPEEMTGRVSTRELRYCLLHELAHLKRQDIAVSYFIMLLQIIHWFNPLVWYSFVRVRNEGEQCCDEAVLKRIGADERQNYGNAVIKLLEILSFRSPPPGVAAMFDNKKQIRRRIKQIRSFKLMTLKSSLLALGLMAGLAAVAFSEAVKNVPAVQADTTKIEKKLNSIIIDHYKCRQDTLFNIFNYLTMRSREGDRDNIGINVILTPAAVHRSKRYIFSRHEFKKASIATIIKILCRDSGLKYMLLGNAVIIRCKGEPLLYRAEILEDSEIDRKLKNITLDDEIIFNDALLSFSFLSLSKISQRFDPAKKGVKIVFKGHPDKRIFISMHKPSLKQALAYICIKAGLQYRVEADKVIIENADIPLHDRKKDSLVWSGIPEDSEISRKLRTIIIPHVSFENIFISDAFKFLSGLSKRYDPKKQGVKFVFHGIAKKITAQMDNLSLAEVLRRICISSGLRLRYRLEDHKVIIEDYDVEAQHNPFPQKIMEDADVRRKLKQIIVDISFRNEPCSTGFARLSKLSTGNDPEKEGVIFCFKEMTNVEFDKRKITKTLHNVPLGNAVDLICKQTGLKYHIYRGEVVLEDKRASLPSKSTATVQVNAHFVKIPGESTMETERKLRLLVNSFVMKNYSLFTGFNELRRRSRTAYGSPINFIFSPAAGLEAKKTHITTDLKNISIAKIIKQLCDVGKLKYVLLGNAVVIYCEGENNWVFLTARAKVLEKSQIDSKLKKIIIPRVVFGTASLSSICKFLQSVSKRYDPEKQGVKIVFKGQLDKKITMEADNLSLEQALIYICITAGAGYRYRVENDMIIIENDAYRK